ncbi:uncharacterized protein CDV56_102936 [Aspergillus thermomutatus]|uniref:Uncharacterized protein n=1 Tax=Aspergillus thermomutatus TaxID=41047 RepID=A0A397G8M2_ASPTH|nr:uncharacterized protein CDV56_102936 [Aspergillus thermomutatus]RHZ46254.1 hypothetical protein CDV56_102936 [Aspergillus thermomutatus]
MATFQKAITAPPSSSLQVMTPPESLLRDMSLRNADKGVLKQSIVDSIRQVLPEMPVEDTSSPGNSRIPNASRLTQPMEVFQAMLSFDATTGASKLASVGAKKNNLCQPPLGGQAGTPPNSPQIAPSEPATMDQPTKSASLLIPSPDDPSAYSTFAEKPRGRISDCKVSEHLKLPATGDEVDAATL